MRIVKCEMPGCNRYVPSDEVKAVKYKGNTILICTECDDDTLEEVNLGDVHDSFKKIEKIRRSGRGKNPN